VSQEEVSAEAQQATAAGGGGRRVKVVIGAVIVVILVVMAASVLSGPPISDDPAELVEMLRPKDAGDLVSERARSELIRMPRRALPAIVAGLAVDRPAPVRIACIQLLAELPGTRAEAMKALEPVVSDADDTVRREAIQAVGELAPAWRSRAVELLAQAMQSEDAESAKLAATALRIMEDCVEAVQALEVRLGEGKGIPAVLAAHALCARDAENAPAAAFLVAALSDPDEKVRALAKECVVDQKEALVDDLVRADSPEARKVLTEDVRQKAIDGLRTIDSRVAAKMLGILGLIGDAESLAEITESFGDKSKDERWRLAAADALATAGSGGGATIRDNALATLRKALREKDDDDAGIRVGAAMALCRLGERDGVDFLMRELAAAQGESAGSDDKVVQRIRAQEALVEAGAFVVPELAAELQKAAALQKPDAGNLAVTWAAIEVLGRLATVEDAFSSSAMRVKVGADLLRILSARKTASTPTVSDTGVLAPPLEEVRQSVLARMKAEAEDDAVRDRMKLADVTDAALVEAIRPHAWTPEIRLTAAVALGRLAGPETADGLGQARDAEQAAVDALRANMSLPGYRQRRGVVSLLHGDRSDVLFYIEQAVSKLKAE
jgi:HEAT repeat protein